MRYIYWKVFLNTNKLNKAQKFSLAIAEVLSNSTFISCENYWKDKSLHCLKVKQKLKQKKPESIVVEILTNISLVSGSWDMDLPLKIDQSIMDFSGITTMNFRFEFVKLASFEISEENDL